MATTEVNNDLDDGREVAPAMSIGGGPGGSIHSRIHESLTLSALLNGGSGIAQGTTVGNANNDVWEYIRGAVWNDDPVGLLFNDESDANHTYSTGLSWVYQYKSGATQWADNDPARMKNPTGRSHYGDLQFLHCMASQLGEQPTVTKQKVMVWLEVLYKLANGEDGITANTLVSDTKLVQFCPDFSLPPNWKPLSYLLAKDSPFQNPDYRHRALGSMFHFIQDSYALGHTRRTLLNPQDKASDNPLKFKAGTTDRWGAIENFHTYEGEDDSSHSSYDHSSDPVPDPNNLSNLDQWNGLLGCRMAVDKCIKLLAFKQAGTKWADGVSAYLDQEVFAVSPNATPADTRIWP